MGIGKACHKLGTTRGKMNIYMQSLRDKVGYVSMKIKHAERQAQMFPSMLGLSPGELSSEQEVQNLWNMDERDANEEAGFTPILTPLEEKNKIIAEQNSKIKTLVENQNKIPSLRETLDKTESENKLLKKKLNLTKRATEMKILDSITNEDFYREDPHLVCVLSATLDEDEFDFADEDLKDDEVKTETESPKVTHRSRKDEFLSSIEDKVDKDNSVHQERLSHLKHQVLDRIKSAKIRKLRNRTDSVSSSVGSKPGSKRRINLEEEDNLGSSPSRLRTEPPATQT